MHRTTILLPPDLKLRANQLALEMGVSLGELIRSSLEMRCGTKFKQRDRFFEDHNFYEGRAPTNLSSNSDDYLYEDKQ